MKVLVVCLLSCVLVGALAAEHAHHHHHRGGATEADEAKDDVPDGAVEETGDDVECENFDTYALCPGGWPMITAEEAKHRVKCCGKAPAENCEMCNRCKVGSFVDSCCTCDDDELVDAFWAAMHAFHHNPNTQADNNIIDERGFIDIIKGVKGEMDVEEEIKIKDVYSGFLTHVQEKSDTATEAVQSNGLADSSQFITYLRENPDVVEHLLGENESPSEGEKQLALDHTKAIIPEWFSGMEGQWAGHLPPPIVRKTKNGLWEVLVPNFEHPDNGYLPAVYRHSQQEAKAYVDEKKAEHLQLEAKQAHATHNIRAKAAENVDLVHSDRDSDGHAGFKRYSDQTAGDRAQNLVGNANEAGLSEVRARVMKRHGRRHH
jgi:hypothetical protein